MTTLSIQLLGSPTIELDGATITIGHSKAMAMLAYLAVTRRLHTRDVLAGLLWTDYDQGRARGEVRRMLWALNRSLGKGWIKADRQTIGLDSEANIYLDVDQIRRQLSVWQEHPHPPEALCRKCVAAFSQAVDRYQANFLEGFSLPDSEPFEQWQMQEARQLRQEISQVLDRLIGQHLAEFPQTLPRLTTAVLKRLALDPYHEPAHRLLMALHAAGGQSSTAREQYRLCVEALRQDLDVAPAPETEALYHRIRQGDANFSAAELRAAFGLPPQPSVTAFNASPVAPNIANGLPPHNLPAPTAPFIGRQSELADLTRLINNPDNRLISIVGLGGMGKTRLALEAGRQVLAHFPNGVFWVELAPLKGSDAIIPVIAEALGYHFQPDSRTQYQQLRDYVTQKELLLLLDNFEHLLDGTNIVTDILTQAPGVTILVTSRQRLNLLDETVFNLNGMGLPNWTSSIDVFNYDAIQLFQQAAQRLQPAFTLTSNNLANVVQICRLVEGMPLGILLAASWISVLSPAEIRSEIQQGIDILAAAKADLPGRQRSIRAVFNHSWQMLTEAEQQAFMKLAIFRAGFTREAAQTVANMTLRQLQSLINKAFIAKDPASERYQIHELLRQYAEAQLLASGDYSRAMAAHAKYYLGYLGRQGAGLKGASQLTALKRIEADFENVRQEWLTAIERKQIAPLDEALESMYLFCHLQSRLEDGKSLFDAARTGLAPLPGEKSQPVWHKVQVRFYTNETTPQLKQRLQRSLVLAQARDDPAEAAFCLHSLAAIAHYIDQEPTAAIQYYEQSATLYRQLNERYHLAHILSKLGEAYHLIGQTALTRRYVNEAYELQQAIGDQMGQSETLRALAMTAYQTGQYEQSFDYMRRGFAIQQQANFIVGIASSHLYSGWLMCIRGEITTGRKRIEKGLALALDVVDYSTQAWCYAILSLLDAWAGDLETAGEKLAQAQSIEADPFRQTGAGNSFLNLHINWVKSLLLLSKEEIEAAKNYLSLALNLAVQTKSHPYVTHLILVLALFRVTEEKEAEAVALMGLAAAQPDGVTGWMDEWAWLANTCQTARERLGPAGFNAAWQQGASQSLMAVAQALVSKT